MTPMMWWYTVLVALRILGSLVLVGMVHPDEFFQSQEIMARHFVPEGALIRREFIVPWEFHTASPNRSIIFPLLIAGLPYKLLDILEIKLTGWLLLVVPRLFLCFLSFLVDAILYRIVGNLNRHQKRETQREKQAQTLVLFASSWPTFIFLCRPFSNTFETLILAGCLAVLFLINPHQRALYGVLHVQTFLLGSFLALGVFTRFTFIVFFLPLGLELARQQDVLFVHAARRKRDIRRVPGVLRRLTALVAVALQGLVSFWIWTMGFIVMDTLYYQPQVFQSQWKTLQQVEQIARKAVIAPMNNLLYNLQYENLKLHGVHPRYTHLVVNMPMLFGPMFLVFVIIFLKSPTRSLFGSMCVFFPLMFLSLAPHQEARFMLPAIVPLHLFCAVNSRTGVVRFLTKQKLGKLLWLVYNLSFTFFFGILHQGGVVPMLLSLSAMASNSINSSHPVTSAIWGTSFCNFDGIDKTLVKAIGTMPLVFAKTYMPPRFLLTGMPAAPAFQVIDLAGNPLDELSKLLTIDKVAQLSFEHGTNVFLVLPTSVNVHDVGCKSSVSISTVSPLGRCVPHVSTEHLALDKSFGLELYLIGLRANGSSSLASNKLETIERIH